MPKATSAAPPPTAAVIPRRWPQPASLRTGAVCRAGTSSSARSRSASARSSSARSASTPARHADSRSSIHCSTTWCSQWGRVLRRVSRRWTCSTCAGRSVSRRCRKDRRSISRCSVCRRIAPRRWAAVRRPRLRSSSRRASSADSRPSTRATSAAEASAAARARSSASRSSTSATARRRSRVIAIRSDPRRPSQASMALMREVGQSSPHRASTRAATSASSASGSSAIWATIASSARTTTRSAGAPAATMRSMPARSSAPSGAVAGVAQTRACTDSRRSTAPRVGARASPLGSRRMGIHSMASRSIPARRSRTRREVTDSSRVITPTRSSPSRSRHTRRHRKAPAGSPASSSASWMSRSGPITTPRAGGGCDDRGPLGTTGRRPSSP